MNYIMEIHHKILFVFKLFIVSFFIVYELGFLEEYKKYYDFIDELFKLFVAIFCMYLFNPFEKNKKISEYDHYFAFVAGALLLVNVKFLDTIISQPPIRPVTGLIQ
jgi:cell division protein FtsW (lipid II flippase)